MKLEDEMTETRLIIGARDRQVKELSQRLVTAGQLCRHLQQRHHTLDTTHTRSLNDKYVKSGRNKQFWTRTEFDKSKVSDDVAALTGLGEEAVPELLRQREMLERSVATLRAQAQKQTRAHKDKLTKLVQENSDLLETVKNLEKRCWHMEEELKQAESMAGLRDPRSGKRRTSRDHLVQIVTRQADMIAKLQDQIRQLQGVGAGGPCILQKHPLGRSKWFHRRADCLLHSSSYPAVILLVLATKLLTKKVLRHCSPNSLQNGLPLLTYVCNSQQFDTSYRENLDRMNSDKHNTFPSGDCTTLNKLSYFKTLYQKLVFH
ncbi:hypothetical protein SK128_007451 [Halocaridina rubra]|uniref:Uncharacterized protein n=1 Tax=Halocaridina rubra TaxID=373956 RepID=A0AAN9A1P3_HALRR